MTIEEEFKKFSDNAIAFHKWMMINDVPERAEDWFHYSDENMYMEFIKSLKKDKAEILLK